MFNRVRLLLRAAAGVGLLVSASVPQLKADEVDKKTVVSFSAPVEISGESLAAGTYVFKTLTDNRDIVIVMNGDESHLVGIFPTIQITAPVIPDKTRIEFREGPADGPEVIHAWFYPGNSIGWEFRDAGK